MGKLTKQEVLETIHFELEPFYYREYPSTELNKYYPLTKLDTIKTIIEN